jgi:hypothetical protein
MRIFGCSARLAGPCQGLAPDLLICYALLWDSVL